MTKPMTGQCLCGASTFRVDGEAKFAIRCFCRDCQRHSGGGSMPQVAVPRNAISHDGPVRTYGQVSASGNDMEFRFCGTCGSPLYHFTAMAPNISFVSMGALDDASGIEIGKDVFEDSRQPWDRP